MSKNEDNTIRIDKWLWAVRIYKTRNLANAACNNNQVKVNSVLVKPSRLIHVGDCIQVKKTPIFHTYKVLAILSQRQSAKVVANYVEDITPPEEIEKLQTMRLQKSVVREKGLGRPTKKERRSLEEFGYL
ncbi:MAG: S4 domain-containing protein [Bacteroidales bacterium]|nr:S4 domain-containing protein [Bacteroidales bacterium]NLK82211.1 RNA-binding S4 domain-containing protein [Bacteroidales bacterium]HPY81765.1 S4 domain-containing protein [Bacteroidales bacterium]